MNKLIISLVLFVSPIDFVLSANMGQIKIYHYVGIIVILYSFFERRKFTLEKRIIRKYKNFLIIILIFIPLNIIFTSHNYIDSYNSTITTYLNLLFNLIYSIAIAKIIGASNIHSLNNIINGILYLHLVFYIIDFITLNIFGFSFFVYISNNPEKYTFGKIFSGDTNWEAGYILFLSLASMFISKNILFRNNDYLKIAIITGIILLFSGSRISLLLYIIYIYFNMSYINKFLSVLILIIIILLVVLIGYEVVFNYSSYYDLKYMNRNPRINDFVAIVSALVDKKRLLFGGGFGRLNNYAYNIYWRKVTNVSNILILQIIGEFGIVVLIIAVIFIFAKIKKLKILNMKIIIVNLIIILQFHNFVYKNFFWILMSIIISIHLYQEKYLIKSDCKGEIA